MRNITDKNKKRFYFHQMDTLIIYWCR